MSDNSVGKNEVIVWVAEEVAWKYGGTTKYTAKVKYGELVVEASEYDWYDRAYYRFPLVAEAGVVPNRPGSNGQDTFGDADEAKAAAEAFYRNRFIKSKE